MVRRYVLATTNANKLAEFRELWQDESWMVESPAERGIVLPVVIEDGATFIDNARLKAVSAARRLNDWVIADDTALEVDCLGGAPGVYSARYAGPTATMQENRQLLLENLSSFPEEAWDARFVCALAVANPQGDVVVETIGFCQGRIVTSSSGTGGFGYDSLFLIPELGKTMASLECDERKSWTHRARAAHALAVKLNAVL